MVVAGLAAASVASYCCGGGFVPGAQIQLRNPKNGDTFTAESDIDGAYFIDNVPPGGPYILTAQAEGHQITQREFTTTLGQKLSLDVELRLLSRHDLHSDDMRRYTWSFLGDWTHSAGNMVIDTQVAANRYGERNYYYKQHDYNPGMVGLPGYLDQFCADRGDCKLPVLNIGGYQGMSNGAEGGLRTTNIQAQTNITNVFLPPMKNVGDPWLSRSSAAGPGDDRGQDLCEFR